jgi:hypothetical protein
MFLSKNWDPNNENFDLILDKTLYEFPVFALNTEYMKALYNIINSKLDSVKNLINLKNSLIQEFEQNLLYNRSSRKN